MKQLQEALREIYLAPLKAHTELYIGVELEFPIVNLTGQATDTRVSKALLAYLAELDGFQVEVVDSEDNPVQVLNPSTDDRILFEVSYNILELAFGKVKTLHQVSERFERYLALIQDFLAQYNHALQGQGIHPSWDKNDNCAVKLPRYQMLLDYLRLSEQQPSGHLHPYWAYGAYICSNQVQLDVNASNYLQTLNLFNQIEAAKAYLFPNSTFSGADWDTQIARDYFWEYSMHGLIPANVGVFPHNFNTDEDFLSHLSETAIFTTSRHQQTVYFSPKSLKDYFTATSITAYTGSGDTCRLTPQFSDLKNHRAYHYQALTRRGTVEFRSVCAQPLAQTFTPVAFHLGLFENMAELANYLETARFFTTYGRDYPSLRRQFSKKNLSIQEKNDIRDFSLDLLKIARKGLLKRNFGELLFLEDTKILK